MDADKAAPTAGDGELNVPRCACGSTPHAEFAQIFAEGWRNQRDYLYVPNMHGADWPQMRELLRRSSCRT